MKRLPLSSGFFLLLLLVGHAKAEPFDESKGYMFYAVANPIRKDITPPKGNIVFDDYVLALSKASRVNFLVDVTDTPASEVVADFPSSPDARNGKWKPTFFNVEGDWCLSHQLSNLRYDADSILFWKEPELLNTAQSIMDAQGLQAAPLPDELELHQELDDYARQFHGWDADAKNGLAIRAKLKDLPVGLKDQITTMTRYGILRPDLHRELFLTPEFWKTARIRLFPAADRKRALVYVAGQDENGKQLPFFHAEHDGLNLLNLPSVTVGPPRSIFPAVPAVVQGPLDDVGKEKAVPSDPFPWLTRRLPGAELEGEQKLQAKVALEEKRRPFKELLESVAHQTGVKLVIGPNESDKKALFTGRVENMPLGTLMGALGRLYGGFWSKESASEFSWHSLQLNALQSTMLRAGRGDYFVKEANWNGTDDRRQQHVDLEQQITDEIGAANSPLGTPISVLADDTQEKLKQIFLEAASESIVRLHQSAWQSINPDVTVAMIRTAANQGNEWQVRVLASDERTELLSTYVIGPVPLVETPPIEEQGNPADADPLPQP